MSNLSIARGAARGAGLVPPGRRGARARRSRWLILWSVLASLAAGRAHALSDEIEVYTGQIAAPGVVNLTIHDYYVADSRRTPAIAGGLTPDQSLTGGTEWAYGATPWLELGAYTPIVTLTRDGAAHFDGAEVRALFTVPNAGQRRFVYGVNVALDLSAAAWNPHRQSVELQPILRWRIDAWSFTLNPNVDGLLDGRAAMSWEPAERLDYTVSPTWQMGLEEYADDTGRMDHPSAWRDQDQRLFAVADVRSAAWTIEPGIGLGLTAGSDRLTVKLILSRDLD